MANPEVDRGCEVTQRRSSGVVGLDRVDGGRELGERFLSVQSERGEKSSDGGFGLGEGESKSN